MSQFIEGMQIKIRQTSSGMALWLMRLATGLFVGLCLTLIAQQIVGYGSLAFWFVMFAAAGAFLRISKSWKPISVVIFNLVFVLVGLLLRMYILVAPG